MARKKTAPEPFTAPPNGDGRWDRAIQHLIEAHAALEQAQSTMLQTQVQFMAQMEQMHRTQAEIIDLLHGHSRMHQEHSRDIQVLKEDLARVMTDLAEAVRERSSRAYRQPSGGRASSSGSWIGAPSS